MKRIVTVMDIFETQLKLEDVLKMSLPFMDDLLTSRIDYLKEKHKAEKDAHDAAQRGSGSQRTKVV